MHRLLKLCAYLCRIFLSHYSSSLLHEDIWILTFLTFLILSRSFLFMLSSEICFYVHTGIKSFGERSPMTKRRKKSWHKCKYEWWSNERSELNKRLSVQRATWSTRKFTHTQNSINASFLFSWVPLHVHNFAYSFSWLITTMAKITFAFLAFYWSEEKRGKSHCLKYGKCNLVIHSQLSSSSLSIFFLSKAYNRVPWISDG